MFLSKRDVRVCVIGSAVGQGRAGRYLREGEYSIMWLYLQKVFSWTPVQFSYYDTVRNSIFLVANLICLPLFTKVFKFHDAVIVLIAFTDKIAGNLVYALWRTLIGLYVAPIVSFCSTIPLIAIRSLVTKSVRIQDLAKAMSLLSFVETLSSIVATPVYSTLVYSNTIDFYPAAFFFVGIGVFGASALFVLATYCSGVGNMYASVQEPEKQPSAEDKQQTTRI